MVRVARLQGWTEREVAEQSFEWILAIAADHLLEAEEHEARSRGGGGAPPAASPTRTVETIEYRLKPKT